MGYPIDLFLGSTNHLRTPNQGIYFVFYGLGTSTGIDWSWTLASFRDQLRHWQQLLVTVVLESLLLYFLERATWTCTTWGIFRTFVYFLGGCLKQIQVIIWDYTIQYNENITIHEGISSNISTKGTTQGFEHCSYEPLTIPLLSGSFVGIIIEFKLIYQLFVWGLSTIHACWELEFLCYMTHSPNWSWFAGDHELPHDRNIYRPTSRWVKAWYMVYGHPSHKENP